MSGGRASHPVAPGGAHGLGLDSCCCGHLGACGPGHPSLVGLHFRAGRQACSPSRRGVSGGAVAVFPGPGCTQPQHPRMEGGHRPAGLSAPLQGLQPWHSSLPVWRPVWQGPPCMSSESCPSVHTASATSVVPEPLSWAIDPGRRQGWACTQWGGKRLQGESSGGRTGRHAEGRCRLQGQG